MDFLLPRVLFFGIFIGYYAQPTGKLSFMCREGEEFDTCRSPCEPTCDNVRRGIQTNCSKPCEAGCFCTSGLVRARDNTCVAPEMCRRHVCKENEEFNECGSSCVKNCSNLNDPIFCSKPCHKGCFCKPNFVRDAKGQCVPPEKCSIAANQRCPVNEQYVICVNFCNTCWEYGICRTPFCRPGCDCKPGFLRNFYGECVTEEQCYSSIYGFQNACGENEEYSYCVNHCHSCDMKGKCGYTQYYCEQGCDCITGYLRNDKGVCIPEQNCYTGCRQDEIFLECGSSCPRTCKNYRSRFHPPCRQQCVPGCFCPDHLVRGPDGRCIEPQYCPQERQPDCPRNEQFYSCVPTCRDTCDNFNNTDAICPEYCTAGCFCKRGMVRRKDGVCVLPQDCPMRNPTCPPREVFYQCLPTCRTTCRSLNVSSGLCTTECRPGCFCQPGFVRNDKGECVRPEDCVSRRTPPTCPPGESFHDCKPTCRNTCENKDSTGPCLDICESGCSCSKGFVRRKDGLCVRPRNCPIVCGAHEEFRSCGTPCPLTCANISQSRHRVCTEQCVRGCFCKRGFVRGPAGRCIHPQNCPLVSTPESIVGRRGEPGDDDGEIDSTTMTSLQTQTANTGTANDEAESTTGRSTVTDAAGENVTDSATAASEMVTTNITGTETTTNAAESDTKSIITFQPETSTVVASAQTSENSVTEVTTGSPTNAEQTSKTELNDEATMPILITTEISDSGNLTSTTDSTTTI